MWVSRWGLGKQDKTVMWAWDQSGVGLDGLLGMNSAVVWPGPAPDSLLPSLRLSLHPTDIPPSALQKKCMEEVGPGAGENLRIKNYSFTAKKDA